MPKFVVLSGGPEPTKKQAEYIERVTEAGYDWTENGRYRIGPPGTYVFRQLDDINASSVKDAISQLTLQLNQYAFLLERRHEFKTEEGGIDPYDMIAKIIARLRELEQALR